MADAEDRDEHYRRTKALFQHSALHRQGFYDAKPGRALKHTLWQRRVRRLALSVVDVLLRNDPGILSVIDVGCGRGDFSLTVARRYPRLREVWGTDFSPETLALARAAAAESPRISFREADVRELPFDDARFDLTFCLNVLHHVHRDDFDQALGELARITRRYLVLEIKNRRNPYYGLIRSRPTETGEAIEVFPVSTSEVTRALSPHGFRRAKTAGLMPGGWPSPLLVLLYQKPPDRWAAAR